MGKRQKDNDKLLLQLEEAERHVKSKDVVLKQNAVHTMHIECQRDTYLEMVAGAPARVVPVHDRRHLGVGGETLLVEDLHIATLHHQARARCNIVWPRLDRAVQRVRRGARQFHLVPALLSIYMLPLNQKIIKYTTRF